MEDEAQRGLAVIVAVASVVVLAGLAFLWGPVVGMLFDDGPRSFDERELDPLLVGTEVVEPPREGCPQGRDAAGDCDAGATVRARGDEPVIDVIAANAEEAGYVAGAAGPDLYRAERGERCLSVARTPSAADTMRVYLTWC